MIRIIHWNILHGGGSRRMPEIILNLLAQKPDLILLSEYRTTVGGQIRGVLADHGLEHQRSSLPAAHKNGLMWASRFPLEVPPSPAPATHGLGTRWLEVIVEGHDLHLTGLHIPDDSRPAARAVCWRAIVNHARIQKDKSHIFLGDFNTGRHGLDEEGRTFTCTSQLGAVCTLGYADAFRVFSPRAREWTWKAPLGSRARPASTALSGGFRLDSALVSPPLVSRLARADYIHSVRKTGISDHSAMVVELDTAGSGKQKCVDLMRETAIF
ncbi:MAG: endonuclease/exonuclease/phosphatase family protein [Phycisphaeraceae bacterium]|nr:endonuclease/exonuclease/phosphatase family protein [Phycisphaeraceae bacterium]